MLQHSHTVPIRIISFLVVGILLILGFASYTTAVAGTTPLTNNLLTSPLQSGCDGTSTITDRNGWTLNHNVTGTDGLRVSDVYYNGYLVIKSAKNVEWHADYGSSGYQDSPGCGGSGGGFPIYPYDDTQVLDLMDGSTVIGFEVVQSFRMGSWGSGCNYRFDQRYQFFADGRFRTVNGAFGKGCGTNTLYRGLMRIDLAVGGTDEGDSIAIWDGSDWQPATTETRWCPEGETNASCTGFVPGLDPNGYRWRITDGQTGTGYYVEPGRGQFGDGGQGDNEFVYAVVHNTSEGDNDLPVFGAGCCNNYNHGPEQYVNGGAITNTNIVLWYIPQSLTDAAAPDYYCWTITGEPNPETYPCFTGPMFIPVGDPLPTPTPSNTPDPSITPSLTPTTTPTPMPTSTISPTVTPTNTPLPIGLPRLLGYDTYDGQVVSETSTNGWVTVKGSDIQDLIEITVSTTGKPVLVQGTMRFATTPAADHWCSIRVLENGIEIRRAVLEGTSTLVNDFGCSGSYLFTDLPEGTYTFQIAGSVSTSGVMLRWKKERQIVAYEYDFPQ